MAHGVSKTDETQYGILHSEDFKAFRNSRKKGIDGDTIAKRVAVPRNDTNPLSQISEGLGMFCWRIFSFLPKSL